jgi:hypothetical protein
MFDKEIRERDNEYIFNAELRYVENLINSWIIFIQAHSHKKTANNLTPRQIQEYNANLLNLFYMLKLHDIELIEPDFNNLTDKYINSLIHHNTIKQLTENKNKVKSIEETIDEDYA